MDFMSEKWKDILFYEICDETKEDADKKNRILQERKQGYAAYFHPGILCRETLCALIEELEAAGRPKVAAVCVGEAEQTAFVTLEELLCEIPLNIEALVFDKAILKKTGCFNEVLSDLTDLELLCRLTEAEGRCVLHTLKGERNSLLTPGGLRTYVYLIRRYFAKLHTSGQLERVYKRMCFYMEEQQSLQEFQSAVDKELSDKGEYERIYMDTAPFVVLQGNETCAGVLRSFAQALAEELTRLGQAVIAVGNPQETSAFLEGEMYKGIAGFQAPALTKEFIRLRKGLKYQFWFDYPAAMGNLFREMTSDYSVLCQDRNHAAFIKKYFGVSQAMAFPPAGIDAGYAETLHKERPYDIVFVGSSFKAADVPLEGFAQEYYEYMLKNPLLTFEEGAERLLAEHSIAPDNEKVLNILQEWKDARRKAIYTYKKKVIDVIVRSGYTIHVYGDDWKGYFSEESQGLIVHSELPVEEALGELGKAKIGLNIMSWHKAGMTERIANIMLAGAVCLTDETTYLKELFADGEEIVCFSPEHLEDLPGIIKKLLEDAGRRREIARAGYRKALSEHTWRRRAEQLLLLNREQRKERYMDQKKIIIFVATHVKFNPPANPVYVPLHVGREGKEDLGYIGDNIGTNISDLNYLFGELTGLFWIWQNVHDMDYVGLCHYRRFFVNEDGALMNREEYLKLLSQYDVIVSKHADAEKSYYEHYGKAHDSKFLDVIGETIQKICPEYYESYEKAMRGTKFFGGNLMVAGLSILKSYANWLFTIFMDAFDKIDVSGYDEYHKRVFGFLSEQMLYVYMTANQLSYCEVKVGYSGEKAETKQLADRLKKLMKRGEMEEAASLFDRTLERRPDLLLAGSDLHGELREIYNSLKLFKKG